jgi:predicted helicase
MACGTGKTFTSLKVAEEVAGAGKRVLFLVPSLALLSQTLDRVDAGERPARCSSFAVCSDSDVGKKRAKDDDAVQTLRPRARVPRDHRRRTGSPPRCQAPRRATT